MGGNLHRGFESLPLRSAFMGPFTGRGQGAPRAGAHRRQPGPHPADRIVVKSNDVYRARFTYSFRVDGFGNIKGIGNGSYRTATWHLSGTNGSHGAFDCVVSMTTTEVAVQVRGHAAD